MWRMQEAKYKSNMIYLIVLIALILGNMLLSVLGVNDAVIEIGYQFFFILIPCLIYIIITKKSFKKTLRLNKVSPKEIGIALILGFLIQPVAAGIGIFSDILMGAGGSQAAEGAMGTGGMNPGILLSLFMIAITPAICEEVFMRGVVLDGYRSMPLWKVALMNGVLFGLFHSNLSQISYATFVGIVLTVVVVYTNSIFPSMIMHFIMNGTSVIGEQYPNGVIANVSSFIESNGAILLIAVVISVVLIIVLLKVLKKVTKYDAENDHSGFELTREEIIENDNHKEKIMFAEWPLMMGTALAIIYAVI